MSGMGSSLFNRSALEAEIEENIKDYGEQKPLTSSKPEED